jgi:hypothetical protein
MAKNKHTINDIQKALMSNTRFIKEEETASQPIEKAYADKGGEPQVIIDPLIMKQFKILAPYLGETPDDLINKALSHFLRLKSLQLDQAISKLTEE